MKTLKIGLLVFISFLFTFSVQSDMRRTTGGSGAFDSLTLLGQIYMKEQADALVDIAAYGQIWVNTATPNELWFTDDAGTDFQLGVGITSETNSLETLTTGIATTEIPIGTAADTVVYASLSSDVTMANDGAVTIASDAVTYDKMQDASGTDKVLGRSTAGAGTIEEITCTTAGRALLDDADASAQRTTLGTVSATSPTFTTGITITPTAGDLTLTSGEIAIDSAQRQLGWHDGTVEVVIPAIHYMEMSFDPGTWYDSDAELWITDLTSDRYPDGIVITEWHVDANVADPDTELDMNLQYCDAVAGAAFPGGSATLIDVMDTTTGNSTESTMSNSNLGSGTIPSGKSLYLLFDADPEGTCTQVHVKIQYYIPES